MGENQSFKKLPVGRALPRKFFARSSTIVGRELLGKILLAHDRGHAPVGGRIVETEAYLSENDPASHSHRGKTQRNSSMFGPAGTSYIYLIYGMHHCFNVVTAGPDIGEAVLVRAVEPLFGIELMKKRRGVERLTELCRGPGRLAQAFGLSRSLDGSCLLSGPITIHEPSRRTREALTIASSPRIGIRLAAELHLRFFIKGSPFVSR